MSFLSKRKGVSLTGSILPWLCSNNISAVENVVSNLLLNGCFAASSHLQPAFVLRLITAISGFPYSVGL
jgi:hypothetical protein